MLNVSEIFGPTLQGEGVSVGRAAVFLRLAGCTVQCRWCDTRYSWDPTHPGFASRTGPLTTRQVWEQLQARMPAGHNPLLVVTGGEPLEQAHALGPLLVEARRYGCRTEIETSGTGQPGDLVDLVDLFTVSPKLDHARPARPTNSLDLAAFANTGRAVFKFVVRNNDDLAQAETIAAPYPAVPIMVMPLGVSSAAVTTVAREIADEVARRGWTLTPRLHLDLWGNQPGR